MKGGYRSGKGNFTFESGAAEKMYKGKFTDDEIDGQGELALKDGSTYRGKFSKGVPDGEL